VIYVYGDLSGTAKDKVVCAAVYIGHEKAWAEVDRKWAAALRFAKVEYFHATDFFAYPPQGEFKGWKRDSVRWRRTAEMFTTATWSRPGAPRQVKGYATGIVTEAFPALRSVLMKAQAPHRIKSMRLLCVTNCLAWISNWFRPTGLPPGERIQVLLEDEQGIGEVVDYFNFMKKRHASLTRDFLSLAPASKRVRPVQVADLFAHESWKGLQAQQKLPAAPPRPSFARMLEGGNLEVRLMTEEDVANSIPKVEQFFEQYPRGYVPRRGPRPRR
jgi:hypothetical protein